MRDWMMVFALFPLTYFAFKNTVSSYFLWGWCGLIAIQTYMYGFMREIALVQVFALITLFMILTGKDQEKLEFRMNVAALLMILFGVHSVLGASFAYPGLARNWELCTNLLKTLLYCVLMPIVITKRYRFHAMLVMIAIGISFHGLIEGLKFISSGGAHHSQGNAKLGDNNHFAMIMVMILPILLYLFQYAKLRIARLGYGTVFVVTCLSIVATSSRGALVALLAVGLWLILTSRQKVRGLLVAALVAVVVVSVAPESWFSRMNSLESVESVQADGSFMGRVIAWKRASAIALKNPLFGGGFHSGQDPVLFEYFLNDQGLLSFIDTPLAHYPAATHSIYFEVMGDLGFVGLFLFLCVMLYAFVLRSQIKKNARKLMAGGLWASDCAEILTASMVAYLVGGAALSAAYFELPYIVVMAMQVLKLLVDAEVSDGTLAQLGEKSVIQKG
jgi:probable O-glycosylation ligase (exosortase A-associated)